MTALLRIGAAPSLALLIAGFAAAGCGGAAANSDCVEAQRIWGPEGNLGPAMLHESCASGSYGTCTTTYSNCVEGVCKYSDSANDDICTLTCASTSDCGGWYCKDGFCQPACTSHTYCDGTLCCSYTPDPADPTQCRQSGCYGG